MKIDEVELRVIRVPFRSAFTTSFGSQTEKHTVIVTVRLKFSTLALSTRTSESA